MAKAKSVFVCNECGYESVKWLGKCPACNEWNTFFEQKLDEKTKQNKKEGKEVTAVALKNVEYKEISRISTGFGELDRVLRRRISRRITNITWWRTRNRKINSNTPNM